MSTFRRNRLAQRYSKPTQGWNAQGFFGPNETTPLLYATAATIKAFSILDPVGIAGQIGLYDKDGDLLPVAAVAADVVYQVVQKQSNGDLKKSTFIKGDELYKSRRIPYLAPFIQQHAIGWDGTSGALNVNIVGGLQEFVAIVKDKSSANQPFPTMEGRSIVRGGSPTTYDIAAQIVRTGGGSYDHEKDGDIPFAVWEVITNIVGTIAGAAAGGYLKIGGSNQIVALGADETASAVPGNYFVDESSSNATKNIIAKIKSSFYDGTDTVIEVDYKNAVIQQNSGSPTTRLIPAGEGNFAVEADLVGASHGIIITGVTFGTHMDVVISEDLADATVTKGDWRQGQGSAAQMGDQEDETIVFDGFTTGNEAFPGDYGFPDMFVDESSLDEYATFYVESLNRIVPSAGTPQNQTLMKANIVIGAIEGSGLDADLTTILGL